MKRILFLPGIVKETIGGAELQARYIAEALEKKVFDVFGIYIHDRNFATPKYPGYFINRSQWVQKVNANILYAKQTYDLIKRIKPDVIYTRAFLPYLLLPAVYYSRKKECKSIWHIAHDQSVERFQVKSYKHLPFEMIDHAALKYGIKYTDLIISQTSHQAALLHDNYKRQVTQVIPNFHPKPETKIDKARNLQIVWVANFKTLKQPELFIRLASELQKYKDIKFIMIGRPGPNKWMKQISQQIQAVPNLTWLGSLPFEKVNEILAQSHIFVNTSRHEGFPNTFIQAWMRKVPVLSLNVDIEGILEKKEVGFICHTFEKLLERAKLLIENETQRERMGLASQKLAFEKYSIETNIPKILSLFTK